MAQRLTGMLKISLPGVDPGSLPTLTADQVKAIPPKLLEELIDTGNLQDYGDLKFLTIEDERHHATIMWVMDWIQHVEQAPSLQHDALEVLRTGSDDGPITYDSVSHEEDTDYITTPATHEAFCEIVKLYMFSLHADMEDLQARLSSTIADEYPVYAAEIIVLLTQLAKYQEDLGDLRSVDAGMLSFLSKRMLCLHNTLVSNKDVLPLLCSTVDSRERCSSIINHVGPQIVERAIREGVSVSETAQTAALLNTFIEKNGGHTSSPASTPADDEAFLPKTTSRASGSKVRPPEKSRGPSTIQLIKPASL